jgi:protein TonB
MIDVSPADAVLLMNGQQVDGAELKGVPPGGYVLTARRVGYSEESRSITLTAGNNLPITIRLAPLRGRLNITPNISGAEITVQHAEPNVDPAPQTFQNNVADLNLPPGEYEIAIDRKGFRGIKRRITIQPAGSVYLEPQLSAWPTENQSPAATATMTMRTEPSGKYFLIGLVGSSQVPASAALLDVFLDAPGQTGSRVNGLLTGFPCEVTLTPIDNVTDYSIPEAPGPGNEWKKLAIKVRPKDPGKPLHFTIRCSSANSETVQAAPFNQDEPVTIRKRVLPNYPSAARLARVRGVVVVIAEIDENGRVVAAKATDGPLVLRQSAENAAKQWEFTAAKRNGVAVRSSQRLEFNFQP